METKKSLEQFDLVIPAKDLLDAIIISGNAYSKKPLTEAKAKNMKLVLGFLNAYIKAFHTKVSYFKLTAIPDKIQMVKKFSKKLTR